MEELTIDDFIIQHLTLEERGEVRPLVEVYIDAFNALKRQIFDSGKEGKAAKAFVEGSDLTLKSKAATLFPSSHAAGQCATQVVGVLIKAHNAMLAFYTDKSGSPIASGLSPSAATKSHLVVYDERELQLIITANCEYDLDVESSACTKWNLKEQGLERHLRER